MIRWEVKIQQSRTYGDVFEDGAIGLADVGGIAVSTWDGVDGVGSEVRRNRCLDVGEGVP